MFLSFGLQVAKKRLSIKDNKTQKMLQGKFWKNKQPGTIKIKKLNKGESSVKKGALP